MTINKKYFDVSSSKVKNMANERLNLILVVKFLMELIFFSYYTTIADEVSKFSIFK